VGSVVGCLVSSVGRTVGVAVVLCLTGFLVGLPVGCLVGFVGEATGLLVEVGKWVGIDDVGLLVGRVGLVKVVGNDVGMDDSYSVVVGVTVEGETLVGEFEPACGEDVLCLTGFFVGLLVGCLLGFVGEATGLLVEVGTRAGADVVGFRVGPAKDVGSSVGMDDSYSVVVGVAVEGETVVGEFDPL